jgi:hypothetical protein
MWRGKIIRHRCLSKTAQAKRDRLRRKYKMGFKFPPILCEKSGRGHFVFVPPEWGKDMTEFHIAMEQYAKTPEIMKVV